MTILIVCVISIKYSGKITFPLWMWFPWLVYLVLYALIDFSFLGIQLTTQYILPVLVGMLASKFSYSLVSIRWILYWFVRLCLFYLILFVIGHLFRDGYTASVASIPMLLSIMAAIVLAWYFRNKKLIYIFYFGVLFLIPLIDVTRMGIMVFIVTFIFHFENRHGLSKIFYSIVGLFLAFLVFNSQSFQEKTFYSGEGQISDLSIDYYNDQNEDFNNSGRNILYEALNTGLKDNPILGNGPRADLVALEKTKTGLMEVHNDYLSIQYNYGWLGLILLIGGFLINFISIYLNRSKKSWDFEGLLRNIILTLFFGFLMFMYSDNILKYTVFYPNFFFALIGIFYSIRYRKSDLVFN